MARSQRRPFGGSEPVLITLSVFRVCSVPDPRFILEANQGRQLEPMQQHVVGVILLTTQLGHPHPRLESIDLADRFRGLKRLVGNTPLLAIEYRYQGRKRTLYSKSENLNMTGSVKDRMALYILEQAYARGTIEPGSLIIEATSGNTGISFAAIGRALGHPVVIFMPEWMSSERKNLIRAFGAEIHAVSHEQGGFLGSIQMAQDKAATLAETTPGTFLPRQFRNTDNSQAHEKSTGAEIFYQLRAKNLRPEAFVAGVGTGGTVMGIGTCLRKEFPDLRVHPLEPSNSPTLSTGHKVGRHRIQGISDEFIPPIVHLEDLDSVVAVDDGDAIRMAQNLALYLGLGVGDLLRRQFPGSRETAERNR